MKTLTVRTPRTAAPIILGSFLALVAVGCSSSKDASSADTTATTSQAMAPASTAAQPFLVRGTVASVSGDQLVVRVDTGAVTVKLAQPFRVFQQGAGNLADVKDSTFIGVTTVKQPDGTERATEIHIFPEELRGLGEGSRMMAPRPSTAASRMTNGSVSTTQSRMSNGNVSNSNGSTLVVNFAGGSQNVTVPSNTPVTEIKRVDRTLAAGDTVTVIVTKAADGSLTSDKAMVAGGK